MRSRFNDKRLTSIELFLADQAWLSFRIRTKRVNPRVKGWKAGCVEHDVDIIIVGPASCDTAGCSGFK
jgi:hypothetical protein